MFRQKTLLVFGALVAMLSAGTALVYRKAVHESPEVMFLLFLTTIMGTSIAMSGIFYRRLEESSESNRSSERRLQDSEARFRYLFDISPFPAALTSLETNRVLAVNERTADRFGIPAEKAVGLHVRDFYVDPAQRAVMLQQLQQAGQVEGVLLQLKTASGEHFWAEIYSRTVVFDGEPAGLAVFHDVTERVNAEQALRASEQRLATENKALTELTARQAVGSPVLEDRLRDILEMASKTVGIERASMWRFEAGNSAIRCVDLFEQSPNRHSSGQLLQRAAFPIYFQSLETERLIPAAYAHHDSRTSEFTESYLKPLGIGAMLDVPLRQNDATIGVLCLEHIGAERVWTADEQNFALSLANLIVVAVSDADRREAVERFTQSEARSSLIVDTAHDAFVGMNSDGNIVMWNAQAAATFGWSAAEAIGQSLADLVIPPAFREAHRKGLKRFLKSGEAPVVNQRLELSALNRQGDEFPIEITITDPISSGDGHFFGAFLRDISERRAHEAELRRAKESAEAATRAKSEFLANMSHELRTPLNGVLGYTQLLQRSHSLTSDQRESLDAIANCGSHLLDLINDVLDLSKIEAGRFELEPRPTDLHQLTVELRHVIAEPARRKGLRFSIEIDPDVPTHIVIDGRHLRQVLLNLLGNAVKFTHEGEFTLILGRAEGDRLYCEVRDTGIGIEEESQQAIFQAFRQTRAGSSAGGTGLGLTISQRLVNSMGGELSVRSRLGHGSSFYFTLPLVAAEGAVTGVDSKEDELAFDARLAPGEHLTALVADDSSINRRILASLLESAGVDVIAAGGGVEAVSLSTEHRPDIVLMDLRMHDLDGLQATRQILANPDTASMPIIMVTASAFGDSRQAAFDAGCVDFIPKPIRAEQLFQKIQRHTKAHFVAVSEEVAEESDTPVPTDGSLREIGKRLEEAAAIGNIADLDAIVVELGKGSATEAKLGIRIARLRAKFDFAAVTQLAESLQMKATTAVPSSVSFTTPPRVVSPSTVLVVDDSPVNIQVLVRTLDGTGHRILVATNGKSAIEIAHRTHPDLILLDVMMPEMDGFEVCRTIKEDPATQDIAIIFLSALGEVADKVAGLQLGAVDYITKPIQAEEVLARVSNHLAVRRLEREVRKNRDELQQELASAAEMQRLILPHTFPALEGLSFAAHYETSRHCGGDYYDVVRVSGEEVGILIADVSGHGAPSAIVMAMIRAVFHAFPGAKTDPPAVLTFINNQFRFMWGSSMMATAMYVVVNSRSLQIRGACCGHLPPLLLRRGDVRLLHCEGTRPLLLMDLDSIPLGEFVLERGDRILFYTDGVTECEDPGENMYEIEGLMKAFRLCSGLAPERLLEFLSEDLNRFSQGRELADDRTLLLISVEA